MRFSDFYHTILAAIDSVTEIRYNRESTFTVRVPAANNGESVGAQMHDNEKAEPANIVTGADGMHQAVGAFPGDQAPTELSSDSLTENPGIIPGASDMPGLDVQQPAAVEGAFNEAGGPVSIGSDGMPMDGSVIRGDQTPAEFGAESLTENAGVVPGVSEMPGMAAEQSIGMEGGIHESGAPVTIGSESEGTWIDENESEDIPEAPAAEGTSIEALNAIIADLQAEVKRLKRVSYEAGSEVLEEKKCYELLHQKAANTAQELTDLRDLVFHQQENMYLDNEPDDQISFPYHTQNRIVVFG